MGEPRYVDNLHCNANLDPFCEVYPLDEDPNKNSLRLLNMNYFLQVVLIFVSAGAGFTSQD